MIRTAYWIALGLFLSYASVAWSQIGAPTWQPVQTSVQPMTQASQPNLAPVPIEQTGVQHSVSQKPVEGQSGNAMPGNSPYYTSAPTYAPTLPTPNYGYNNPPNSNGQAWGQSNPVNTGGWWDGNAWVANAPNQSMPTPAKFPAIISNTPVATSVSYSNNGYANNTYANVLQQQPTMNVMPPAGNVAVNPLPAAPSGPVRQPGAPLQTAIAPPQPTAPPNPAFALQPQSPPPPRPSAPFVDETVFMAGGQSWREYDITPYTSRYLAEDRPEHAIRRWVLAQTGGPGSWFGQETTALKISRDRVQVYQTPEIQARIADVLGRFLYYSPGRFRGRARVYNLAQVKAWRSEYQPRLLAAGARSPGRQAWLIDPVDANRFVNQYNDTNGGYLLGDQRFVIGNGQDATITVPLSSKSYVKNVVVESGYRDGQHNNAAYRPQAEEIDDGIRLRISPLIANDAATIELDVQANATKLEKVKEVTLDATGRPKVEVPEISTAMLDERIAIRPGKFVLLSLGLGPNLDPRFRLFKKERAELVVLLEVTAENANTINGQPIPRPQNLVSSPAVTPPAGGYFSSKPSAAGNFPPTELTQRLF